MNFKILIKEKSFISLIQKKNSVKLIFPLELTIDPAAQNTTTNSLFDRFTEQCRNPLSNTLPFNSNSTALCNGGEIPTATDNCVYNSPCACYYCPISQELECPECTATAQNNEGNYTSNLITTPNGPYYPDPELTLDMGSGYWVGLQANSYYSTIENGGWVVAVGCVSGVVVGAFPVSSTNFGYGRGTILDTIVMIYPAGIAYATGARPQNSTTYPLLALTKEDGDALIAASDVPFVILTDRNPGNPEDPYTDTSVPDGVFCPAGSSPIYTFDQTNNVSLTGETTPNGYMKPCLQKFPPDTCDLTGCDLFDTYETWVNMTSGSGCATGCESSQPYNIDLSGADVDPIADGSDIVVMFGGINNDFAGAIHNTVSVQSDALLGLCCNMFSYEGKNTYQSCVDASEDLVIDCSFLQNLMLGNFDPDRGGYGNGEYAAIGPGCPPKFNSNGVASTDGTTPDDPNYDPGLTGSDMWERFWDWNPSEEWMTVPPSSGDDETFTMYNTIYPPIDNLEKNCNCKTGFVRDTSPLIIQRFTPCDCADSPLTFKTNQAPRISVAVFPGKQSCVSKCLKTSCITPECSCAQEQAVADSAFALGPVGEYLYLPCFTDCCFESTEVQLEEPNPIVTWWNDLPPITGEEPEYPTWYPEEPSDSDPSTIEPAIPGGGGISSCLNDCDKINLGVFSRCTGPCKEVIGPIDSPAGPADDYFNRGAYIDCTGFDHEQQFLDNACAVAATLPFEYTQCHKLVFREGPPTTPEDGYVPNWFMKHISCENEDGDVEPIDPGCDPSLYPYCYYNHIGGVTGYYGCPQPLVVDPQTGECKKPFGCSGSNQHQIAAASRACSIPLVKLHTDLSDVCGPDAKFYELYFQAVGNDRCFREDDTGSLVLADPLDEDIASKCSCCATASAYNNSSDVPTGFGETLFCEPGTVGGAIEEGTDGEIKELCPPCCSGFGCLSEEGCFEDGHDPEHPEAKYDAKTGIYVMPCNTPPTLRYEIDVAAPGGTNDPSIVEPDVCPSLTTPRPSEFIAHLVGFLMSLANVDPFSDDPFAPDLAPDPDPDTSPVGTNGGPSPSNPSPNPHIPENNPFSEEYIKCVLKGMGYDVDDLTPDQLIHLILDILNPFSENIVCQFVKEYLDRLFEHLLRDYPAQVEKLQLLFPERNLEEVAKEFKRLIFCISMLSLNAAIYVGPFFILVNKLNDDLDFICNGLPNANPPIPPTRVLTEEMIRNLQDLCYLLRNNLIVESSYTAEEIEIICRYSNMRPGTRLELLDCVVLAEVLEPAASDICVTPAGAAAPEMTVMASFIIGMWCDKNRANARRYFDKFKEIWKRTITKEWLKKTFKGVVPDSVIDNLPLDLLLDLLIRQYDALPCVNGFFGLGGCGNHPIIKGLCKLGLEDIHARFIKCLNTPGMDAMAKQKCIIEILMEMMGAMASLQYCANSNSLMTDEHRQFLSSYYGCPIESITCRSFGNFINSGTLMNPNQSVVTFTPPLMDMLIPDFMTTPCSNPNSITTL